MTVFRIDARQSGREHGWPCAPNRTRTQGPRPQPRAPRHPKPAVLCHDSCGFELLVQVTSAQSRSSCLPTCLLEPLCRLAHPVCATGIVAVSAAAARALWKEQLRPEQPRAPNPLPNQSQLAHACVAASQFLERSYARPPVAFACTHLTVQLILQPPVGLPYASRTGPSPVFLDVGHRHSSPSPPCTPAMPATFDSFAERPAISLCLVSFCKICKGSSGCKALPYVVGMSSSHRQAGAWWKKACTRALVRSCVDYLGADLGEPAESWWS
jgi:hypothetical protein